VFVPTGVAGGVSVSVGAVVGTAVFVGAGVVGSGVALGA
jgi:hypothetical protein